MKKIWFFIRKVLLSPLVAILLFTLLGCIIYYFFNENKSIIVDYILPCMGIGISVAIVQCAFIQNRIQKDNVKIQLFDKRYSIYKSVLDTITIIHRDNWERYILFYKNDISEQLIEIEENLYQSVQLSRCLFDKELYSKIVIVNDAFCEVAEAYKNMLIDSSTSMNSQEKAEFLEIYQSQLSSEKGFNSDDYKEKFPKAYIAMMELAKQCEDYINLINNLGIIESFQKYLTVNDLEK